MEAEENFGSVASTVTFATSAGDLSFEDISLYPSTNSFATDDERWSGDGGSCDEEMTPKIERRGDGTTSVAGPAPPAWSRSILDDVDKTLQTYLRLAHMDLGDRGLEALSEALGRGAGVRIKALYLNSNNISDVGAYALAEALRQRPASQLRTIHLDDNPAISPSIAKLLRGVCKKTGVLLVGLGSQPARAMSAAVDARARGASPLSVDLTPNPRPSCRKVGQSSAPASQLIARPGGFLPVARLHGGRVPQTDRSVARTSTTCRPIPARAFTTLHAPRASSMLHGEGPLQSSLTCRRPRPLSAPTAASHGANYRAPTHSVVSHSGVDHSGVNNSGVKQSGMNHSGVNHSRVNHRTPMQAEASRQSAHMVQADGRQRRRQQLAEAKVRQDVLANRPFAYRNKWYENRDVDGPLASSHLSCGAMVWASNRPVASASMMSDINPIDATPTGDK